MTTTPASTYRDAIDTIVAQVKAEIGVDIALRVVPETIGCYAELHDYVDANNYADTIVARLELTRPWSEFINDVTDQVDVWLRAGRPADIKRVGPVSLDLCKVADGTYDAYFEPMLHVWDIAGIAAGTVVVWEAQGTLSRWDGERIHWRHDNDVVASNGLIIRELQHYLQQYPWLDSINQR